MVSGFGVGEGVVTKEEALRLVLEAAYSNVQENRCSCSLEGCETREWAEKMKEAFTLLDPNFDSL